MVRYLNFYNPDFAWNLFKDCTIDSVCTVYLRMINDTQLEIESEQVH